jgi:hypothetical protein
MNLVVISHRFSGTARITDGREGKKREAGRIWEWL